MSTPRRQSSLDVSAEAINEISSEVTKLVFDYFTGVSRLPVFAENWGGKTTNEVEAELAYEGVPLDKLDRLNESVMSAVQGGGKAYLSNATIHGRFALRVCITNFRTTRADIDQTVEIIRGVARQLEMSDKL